MYLGCTTVTGIPVAVMAFIAFLLFRASQAENPLLRGGTISEWVERADDSDPQVHAEAIGVLAGLLNSIADPGPMNCAGPDPFTWVEQRRIAWFCSDVRSRLPQIIALLEVTAADQEAEARVVAIQSLTHVSSWTDAAEVRRLLPLLIKACHDEDPDVRQAARECIIENLAHGFRGYNDYVGLPIQDLIPILTAPDLSGSHRYYAVVSLGMIGPEAVAALPRLEQIIADAEQNPDGTCVVQQARWAMQRISAPGVHRRN